MQMRLREMNNTRAYRLMENSVIDLVNLVVQLYCVRLSERAELTPYNFFHSCVCICAALSRYVKKYAVSKHIL